MRTHLFALLVALIALFAACSSADDFAESAGEATAARAPAATPEPAFDRDEADAFDDAEFEPAEFEEAAADEAAGGVANLTTTGSAGVPPAAQLPDLGRDIIYTAHLELASTDITTATGEAIRTIEGLGGFVFSQDTRGGTSGSSVIVFKVLPEQFQRALSELGEVGTVRSQSISADDVTSIVVDLQSRITTAEASVARLQDFLQDAESIEVIASLENQLLDRETTLEQLRGQLRSVQDQVELATITVTVVELLNRPGLTLDVASYGDHDAGFNCPDANRVGSVDAGAPVTVCYSLTNVGDTELVDLAIDDPELGASLADLIVVEGSPASLAPGERLLVAHEIEIDDPLRLRTSATATALDTNGDRLADEVRATAPRLRIDVQVDDSGLPGFSEVLNGSWNALVTLGILAALGLIAIAPFAALALVLGPVVWFVVRRVIRPSTATDASAEVDGPDGPDGPDVRNEPEASTVSF